MTDLGTLPGGNYATANSLSPDGSVVIGISSIAIYEDRAFRWTAAGGLESLGVLPVSGWERHSFRVAGGSPRWQAAGNKRSRGNRRPDDWLGVMNPQHPSRFPVSL
jgi:hypothetical protein